MKRTGGEPPSDGAVSLSPLPSGRQRRSMRAGAAVAALLTGSIAVPSRTTAAPPATPPAGPAVTASAATPSPPLSPRRPGGRAPAEPTAPVLVWVDLDLPELASLPRGRAAERAALHARIEAQQDQVMARLRALGAVEQARVQVVRNALAVRIAPDQIDAARQLRGVRAVRPVRNTELHHPPESGGPRHKP